MLRVTLATFAAGLGVVALAGYVLKLDAAFDWSQYDAVHLTRMALHTSIGFILVSLGILARAWSRSLRRSGEFLPWWAPTPWW